MRLFAAEPATLTILVLIPVLYMLVHGLANPHTRPIVIGLGILGLGLMFLLFVQKSRSVVQHEVATQEQAERFARTQPDLVKATPLLAPAGTASETNRPKMSMLTALEQAVVKAWTARDATPVAESTSKPAITGPTEMPEKPLPPAWIDYLEPKMQKNGLCEMGVPVGAFTTQLECERELPKAVQRAVSEYAELSLGPEAARVTLPDDVLKGLVQARWTDVRPMEIDGGSRDMYTLHALVVFDADLQNLLKSEVQRVVSSQRVKVAAIIFGGVFGLLTLAWGSLRWATRRRQSAGAEPAQAQHGSVTGSVVVSAVVVTAVVVVLAALI